MEVIFDFIVSNALQLIGSLIAILLAFFGIRFQEKARLQQYFGELRVWSLSALDDLSEAAHLCQLDPKVTDHPSFYNRRHKLLVSLSSKIDQGRLFFPNTKPAKFSKWRVGSSEQLRQGPLSALLYAYGAVKEMSYVSQDYNTDLWDPLIDAKRDFTDAMQAILDPRNKNKQFELAMKKKHFQKLNSK